MLFYITEDALERVRSFRFPESHNHQWLQVDTSYLCYNQKAHQCFFFHLNIALQLLHGYHHTRLHHNLVRQLQRVAITNQRNSRTTFRNATHGDKCHKVNMHHRGQYLAHTPCFLVSGSGRLMWCFETRKYKETMIKAHKGFNKRKHNYNTELKKHYCYPFRRKAQNMKHESRNKATEHAMTKNKSIIQCDYVITRPRWHRK